MAKIRKYPVNLDIKYQEKHSRLTVFFRIFLAIPILIILGLLSSSGGGSSVKIDTEKAKGLITEIVEQEAPDLKGSAELDELYQTVDSLGKVETAPGGNTALIIIPLILMILFRRKYPRWWFDFNVSLIKFSTRVSAYLGFMRDEYPSTDQDQAVKIDIPYPGNPVKLKRGMPLVKWLLAIPHYIVLAILILVAIILTIAAWFAVLISGRYPRSIFDYNVGVMRWCLRVQCYAMIMTTDTYPPFSLKK